MGQQVPVRLGPLALLLTVISICLTVLAILTWTTAQADQNLAVKYADTVSARYQLEEEGQIFLRDVAQREAAEEDVAQIASATGAELDEEGRLIRTFTNGGTTLRVGLTFTDTDYEVFLWKIEQAWEADEEIGGLWSGN